MISLNKYARIPTRELKAGKLKKLPIIQKKYGNGEINFEWPT